MADVTVTHLYKSYGKIDILKGINLDIQTGEFIVFVGPSGCGKSTLLRCISGLEEITGGTLKISGNVVNDVPPAKRGIAMVFQSYALYPHMTVYDNMAFGMKLQGGDRSGIDKRVREAAEILQITPYLDRLPRALSGGQRQRVAIGRAIVRDPKVYLFDEPLSNLDAALRVQTRIEIARLHENMEGATMVYVTHDQVEAMTLADKIVVLRAGYVEQVGSPMELYQHPANEFVAQFIGSPSMNILPADVRQSGDHAEVKPLGGHTVTVPLGVAGAAQMKFGVRPENLRRVANGEQPLFEGPVSLVEQLGEVQLVYVDTGREDIPLIAKLPRAMAIERGQRISLTADAGALHLFDENGKAVAA